MTAQPGTPYLTADQAGRELFAVRPLPGPGFLQIVLVTAAMGYGLAYLAPERDPILALAGAAGVLLVHLLVAGSGWLDQHRVCEHAVLLGPTLPAATAYVVPLSTIDPASVRTHRRANFAGKRLGGFGARNIRMAVYSTTAVSFSGLVPGLAHERRRGAAGPPPAASMYDNVAVPPPPVTTWLLGVRDPEPLLLALEQALTSAGAPGARGLACRALADPIIERARWQR